MQQKNVHWFPGHMVKAMREIENRLNSIEDRLSALEGTGNA